MERELALYEVAGYLSFPEMYFKGKSGTIYLSFGTNRIGSGNVHIIAREHWPIPDDTTSFYYIQNLKPILYPSAAIYCSINHNGKEIVPICEIANVMWDNPYWHVNKKEPHLAVCPTHRFVIRFYINSGFSCMLYNSKGDILPVNMVKIFDKLHEYKIDYRNLIKEKVAISVYELENNPYKLKNNDSNSW